MLNGIPDWLCAIVSPVSRALGWAIFGDPRPLCAIAYERCGREGWAWRFVRFVGVRHASESFEAWPPVSAEVRTRNLQAR